MWIKTQKGNLCNLDWATDVTMSMSLDREKPYEVRVYSNGLDDFTTIFSGTKEQCRDVVNELGMFLTVTYINSLNKHNPE